MKYYVKMIDGTWKLVKKEDIQDYLNYGCTVKTHTQIKEMGVFK